MNTKSVGGGEVSAYELIKWLSRDHKLVVITTSEHAAYGEHEMEGFRVINAPLEPYRGLGKANFYIMNKKWITVLEKYLHTFSPDIIMGQSQSIPANVAYARNKDVVTVNFIRAYENFPKHLGSFDYSKAENGGLYYLYGLRRLLIAPVLKKYIRWTTESLKKSDLLISNSNYMKEVISDTFDLESEVVYPFVNIQKYKNNEEDPEEAYVTFVKPTKRKGVEIFLKIAEKLPGQPFLCVGTPDKEYEDELAAADNIKYLGWSDEMKSIYARTSVLLVPSVWPEPFGRVAVEGMCNGIPVIAANNGGLGEVVGDAGILVDEYRDVDSWVEAISDLQSDDKKYDDFSRRALERSERFRHEEQLKRISKIIEKVLYKENYSR